MSRRPARIMQADIKRTVKAVRDRRRSCPSRSGQGRQNHCIRMDRGLLLASQGRRQPDLAAPLRLAAAMSSPGTAVMIAGYPIERPHLITADRNCRVVEISSDKKLHHTQGDSGGPFLNKDNEGLILGVNVLVPNLMHLDLREQSKKWGAAVSAPSISEFLVSPTH